MFSEQNACTLEQDLVAQNQCYFYADNRNLAWPVRFRPCDGTSIEKHDH